MGALELMVQGFANVVQQAGALGSLHIGEMCISDSLRLERLQLPERSGPDVALCYMEGEADDGLLRALREKLMHIQLRSVAMSQETIAEAIAPRQFWNPFPKEMCIRDSPCSVSGRYPAYAAPGG